MGEATHRIKPGRYLRPGPIRITIEDGHPPFVATHDPEANIWHFYWDEEPSQMHPFHLEQFQDGEWHTLGRQWRID